jgi:hypothetical protein
MGHLKMSCNDRTLTFPARGLFFIIVIALLLMQTTPGVGVTTDKHEIALQNSQMVLPADYHAETSAPRWFMMTFWNYATQMNGHFTAVANTIQNWDDIEGLHILPLNIAYGYTTDYVWFQFCVLFLPNGLVYMQIEDNSYNVITNMTYHQTVVDRPYVPGASYDFSLTVTGTLPYVATFAISKDGGIPWTRLYTVPSNTILYNPTDPGGMSFSPASALEGLYSEDHVPPAPWLTSVPTFEFEVGDGMSSYTYIQSGNPDDSAIAGGVYTVCAIEGGGRALWKMVGGGSGVGGFSVPVDKVALLAPHIGLLTVGVVTVFAMAVYAKRVKRTRRVE